MMRLVSFQDGVLTATNRHSMATTNTSDVATYRRKTDKVDANIDMAGKECVCVCVGGGGGGGGGE